MSATENVLIKFIGKFLMTWMFENDNIFITGCMKRQGTIWSPVLEQKKYGKSSVKHTLEILVLFANMTKKKKIETQKPKYHYFWPIK